MLWQFILGKTVSNTTPTKSNHCLFMWLEDRINYVHYSLKVWKKRPIQSSFCTFKNTILFIFVYEKMAILSFSYTYWYWKQNSVTWHFRCRKNTVINALLREEKRRHEQWLAVSLKSSTLGEEPTPLVTLIYWRSQTEEVSDCTYFIILPSHSSSSHSIQRNKI